MASDPTGPRLILIDGYNVIRRTPGLAAAERANLAAGREALITKVRMTYRSTPYHVVIVFDGDGDSERSELVARMPRGKVIYTARNETADSVVARVASDQRAAGMSVVVVSDDMDVRQNIGLRGATAASVEQLARKLNEPDKYRRRQDAHRRAIREQWRSEADDAPRPPRTGNPRRAPKRRRDPSNPDL